MPRQRKTYTKAEASAYLEKRREKAKEYSDTFFAKNVQISTTIPAAWQDAVKKAAGGNASQYVRGLVEKDLKEKGYL